MPALDADRRTLQARTAAARRWGNSDADELARELTTARLAEYIQRIVNGAPPLTPEQRDRLALLLRGSAA